MARQKTAQRFCYKCGAEIPEGSTYCRVCGYRKSDGKVKLAKP